MTQEVHIIDRRQLLTLGGAAELLAATGGLPFRVFAQPGAAEADEVVAAVGRALAGAR